MRLKVDRRRFLQSALAAPMVTTFPLETRAQSWPTRNITMVVAFPPGGQADLALHALDAAAPDRIADKKCDQQCKQGDGRSKQNAQTQRMTPRFG